MWVRITFVAYVGEPCHPTVLGELIKETERMFILGWEAYQEEGYDEETGQLGVHTYFSADDAPKFINKDHVLRVDTLVDPPKKGFTPYKDGADG